MKRTYFFSLLFVSLLACKSRTELVDPVYETGTPTEIGQAIGASTTKTIGPAGGTLSTPDGKLTLTFPAGAVGKETPITVQPVENKALNGVGTGYEFGPDGTKFAKPVTFTYRYTDQELLGTTPESMGIAFQNKDRIWMLARRATVDRAARTITAQVTHFSWWALVAEFRLDPEQDSLFVGQTKELNLKVLGGFNDLGAPDTGSLNDLLAPLTDRVASRTSIQSLALNGQDALKSTQVGPDGLLMYADHGSKAQLVYQAPHDKVPAQNPVAISVTLRHGGKAQLMLVSNLFVKGSNNFYIDGQPFKNARADGTLLNGDLTLSVVAEDVTDPTKISFVSILVKGAKVGSFPFAVDKTVVGGSNAQTERTGESLYRKCKVKTSENGTVIIEKLHRVNGKLVVRLNVTGKVVVAHDEDEKCRVLEHETMPISGEIEAILHTN